MSTKSKIQGERVTVDEFDFRDLCHNLEASYRRLGQLRHTRTRPPEIRSALKPAPRPAPPGNPTAIATLIDCETRLRQVAFNALGDINIKLKDGDGRAFRLCQLMAFHAHAISQLEWATDLADEIHDQNQKLDRAIQRIEPGPGLSEKVNPEQGWGTAAAIARLTTQATGIPTSRKQISYWGASGKINVREEAIGKTYNLAECITVAREA